MVIASHNQLPATYEMLNIFTYVVIPYSTLGGNHVNK